MKKPKNLSTAALLIVLTACQTQSPTPPVGTPNPVPSLTLSPSSVNVNAGDAATTFSASVKDSSRAVSWTLSGPGTLEPTTGPSTAYTPPASVTGTQAATLTATLGTTGASVSAPIAIYPASVTPPAEPPAPLPPTPPATPPSGDTTAPSVVSVTPANGATGATSDARIVVTFSEAMDTDVTQGAYASPDLPPTAVTFAWNSSSTVLTVTPKVPLTYAMGDPAIRYGFSLKGGKDVAGNVLPPLESAFTTLREMTYRLLSQPALDGSSTATAADSTDFYLLTGDASSNQGLRGFVSFDLSEIPVGVSGEAVVQAELAVLKAGFAGDPYVALNDCTNPEICTPSTAVLLEHVAYGDALESSDYATPSLAGLGSLSTSRTPTGEFETADVLSAVRDDLNQRGSRSDRSQYRLRFPLETNRDGVTDYVAFTSGEASSNQPVLTVSCLVP